MKQLLAMGFLWLVAFIPVYAESIPRDYPESLHQELQLLQDTGATVSADPRVLLMILSRLYLRMGDDLWTDNSQRIEAYQTGARFAQRALQQDETNALAHFLYAANAGNAAHLQGLTASARVVPDLKAHVRRALELQPGHAPSLHMMGRMLEELPWILGGDSRKALDYLERAVAADPSYAHARLDLAKLYVKRKNFERARRELETLLQLSRPDDPYAWNHRYRPEAEKLLVELKKERR